MAEDDDHHLADAGAVAEERVDAAGQAEDPAREVPRAARQREGRAALQVERALYASALLVAGHLALRGLVVSAQGGL